MARGRQRGAFYQPGFAVAVGLVGAVALLGACSPSSGKASDFVIPSTQAGGAGAGKGGAAGAQPNAGGAAGVAMGQGGIVGAGGIIPQAGTGNGGFDPGAGGFDPGAGGFDPGAGGGWGNTGGGLPPGVGGTCGTNNPSPPSYPPCTTCTGGFCVPTSELTGAPVELLEACDGTSACVPEQIVNQAENLLLRTCTSLGRAEGRCTSLCIPAARNLSAYLPQDICASTERCVPCYSPNDGSDLGICKLGCDPGPVGQPFVFGTCCQGAGRCAPASALPPDTAKNLGRESCQSSELCVPAKPIADPAYRFPCCTAGTASGICAPACVIDQNPQGGLLKQNDCAADEKCVPCANPLNGQPLGACTDRNGVAVNKCVP